MTRKQKIILVDLISYVLVGLGGFSYVTQHPDLAYAVTLVAGAINKFVPKLLGVDTPQQ